MPHPEPFWEAAYRDNSINTFGEPSLEIVQLASVLPKRARILDIGCGDGRNALFLASHHFDVHAIDISARGIEKLLYNAGARGVTVNAEVADIANYTIEGHYDLIVAHGVLHLLPRESWLRTIQEMKQRTLDGGYNVVAVFTDAIAPPADLAPFMHGIFREGELRGLYNDWTVEQFEAYILDDEHPGAEGSEPIRHRHPINKVVARKMYA